ncbi:unnamed protein product [Calypogeia fissa]
MQFQARQSRTKHLVQWCGGSSKGERSSKRRTTTGASLHPRTEDRGGIGFLLQTLERQRREEEEFGLSVFLSETYELVNALTVLS